ncbi:ATP-binding protein [Pacificispira sp.]|uniref:sensor histidine kinase n=1 Tax=Pacificispira sp. TaxID=2888761 RepID=UPI003B517046
MRLTTVALKHVILAGVALIEVVTAAAFLLAFHFYATQSAEQHARSSMHWALTAVEQELSLFLGKVETVADLTLGLSQSEILDFADSDRIERYFFDALLASPRFTGIYFAGTDGSFVFVTREAPQIADGEVFIRRVSVQDSRRAQKLYARGADFRTKRTIPDDGPIFDGRTRPWYAAAIENNRAHWSEPYVFYTSGQPGITVSSRVHDPRTGDVLGVVGLDLSFQRLSQFVQGLEISDNGKAFIADRSGRLIAFPLELSGEPGNLPAISQLADSVAAEAFRLANIGESGVEAAVTFDHGGTEYVAALNVLSWENGEWVVGAYAPTTDFLNWFGDVQVATFWLTMILMAAGMLGGLALWRTVQTRLARIQAGAEEMIRNTGQPFVYEPSGFLELQTTERALTVMADAVVEREEALQALNEKLAEVMRAVDRMPIGIGVFTPNGPIRYVNAVAAAILGLHGDGVEKFDANLIGRLDACAAASGGTNATLSAALENQTNWEGELSAATLHGRDETTIYRMIAVPLPPKSSGKWVFAVEDVTVQKGMERDLISALETATEASQAKSMFLANMSHELRTPLNSVLGYGDMMRNEIFGPVGDPHYAEYIENILTSGHTLLDILSNLLDLTAVETGRMTLKAEREDLTDIIGEAVRPHRAACQSAGLALALDLPDALPVEADATKLRQAIGNLVQNAARYARGATQLSVSVTDAPGRRVRIVVEDDGIGIPPDRFERVLQPFRRSVENSHLAASDGVGLGLPIAKAIVELHGGTMTLERPDDGKGLRIVLILPICAAG